MNRHAEDSIERPYLFQKSKKFIWIKIKGRKEYRDLIKEGKISIMTKLYPNEKNDGEYVYARMHKK